MLDKELQGVCVCTYNILIIIVLLKTALHFTLQDLAARNISVSKDEMCKISDFSLARETVDEIYEVNKVN